MVKAKETKEERKQRLLIESDYYNEVLDAWFIALEKAGRNPNCIMKKYILEDGGIINHQRFNHYFRTLEALYDITRIRFCSKVKTVGHDFEHQILRGDKLWELYLDAVGECRKECKIALIRNDISFFEASLLELHYYFENVICETSSDGRAYMYCMAAAAGIVKKAVEEWDSLGYDQVIKSKIARDIAGMLYCLDHPATTFSRVIRRG